MRGSKIFNEIRKIPEAGQKKTRGRNTALVTKRNDCLTARYFYYVTYTNKSYDALFVALESEFFLTRERINTIIQENEAVLQVFKKEMISIATLKSYYPHFRWEY